MKSTDHPAPQFSDSFPSPVTDQRQVCSRVVIAAIIIEFCMTKLSHITLFCPTSLTLACIQIHIEAVPFGILQAKFYGDSSASFVGQYFIDDIYSPSCAPIH